MRRMAAIMAGGRGERLWPRSRTQLPKQFLSLSGGPSFLQQTYDRLAGMAEAPDVLVLTAADTLELVRRQLPGLDPAAALGEPLGRDTAATAALAAVMARAMAGEDAVLALVPSDHAVFDAAAFRTALSAAYRAAERYLCPVLLGIPPTRPETGYGYILRGEDLEPLSDVRVAAVGSFVEKPPLERAAQYLAGGRHLWNSGICVCRTDVLLGGLRLYRPELAAFADGFGGRNPAALHPADLRARMEPLSPISLDYALLERVERAIVVDAPMAWDDVGSWEALSRLHPQDACGNVQVGKAVLSDTERTVVYGAADGRLIVTHGVRNLVVIDTPDSILVAERDALPGLKSALGAVRASGYEVHLDRAVPASPAAPHPGAAVVGPEGCRVIDKPWGREVWWAVEAAYAAKRIEVRAGHALSLQYHERKHETLYFLSGRLRLRLGDRETEVGPGQVAAVPPGTVHRLEALTDAVVFEVSTPELGDVVRLEDRYGRAGTGASLAAEPDAGDRLGAGPTDGA